MIKIKQLFREDAFLDNFDKINAIIKTNAKQIRILLIGMFPHAKEIIEYHYNDEDKSVNMPFVEWRRRIFEIDKFILEGPKIVNSTKIKLDKEDIEDRKLKYNKYIEDKDSGKPAKYFRNDDIDPRDIDYKKLPPVTLVDRNTYFEADDGIHRIFLAQINKKPLRAFVWKQGKNTHQNVQKIQSLFKDI